MDVGSSAGSGCSVFHQDFNVHNHPCQLLVVKLLIPEHKTALAGKK
jgi:hypothetical protein